MNGFRKNLIRKLKDKVFRDEYVAENVRAGVAYQIKTIREQRGWTQAHLAKLTGKKQSNIARLEDPDYGKFSIQTLLDLASAFDVWLSIEFVSFRTGLYRTQDRTPGALGAEPFVSDFNMAGTGHNVTVAPMSVSSSELQLNNSWRRDVFLPTAGGGAFRYHGSSEKELSIMPIRDCEDRPQLRA